MVRWTSRFAASLAVAGGLLTGCVQAAPPTASPGTVIPSFTCAEPQRTPLPEWARGGFTPPDQPVLNVVGEKGAVIAVLFGWPLREKQPEGKNNKVLWIAKSGQVGPLVIEGVRGGDGATARRVLADGPGPSIVDLPQGCWRLDLSWPGAEDRLYLRYLEPA